LNLKRGFTVPLFLHPNNTENWETAFGRVNPRLGCENVMPNRCLDFKTVSIIIGIYWCPVVTFIFFSFSKSLQLQPIGALYPRYATSYFDAHTRITSPKYFILFSLK